MPLPYAGFLSLPYESPFFWSLPMIILLLAELAADFLGKEWTVKKKKIFFVSSLSLYIIGNAFWIYAVLNGVGLARGAILFSVGQEIAAIFIGIVYFKEKLNNKQLIGLMFGLISIMIMGGF